MRDKVNDVARLTLMRDAILNIEEFVVGVDSCNAFVSDKLLCHAVIYNLQCIGEGAYKLSRDYVKSHPEIDWESIEGLRHVLVHDYYAVDMQMVWMVVEKDLPILKEYLRNQISDISKAIPPTPASGFYLNKSAGFIERKSSASMPPRPTTSER